MTQEEFASRLHDASERTIVFTQTLVSDELPDNYRFVLRPNSSYDGNELRADQMIYPQDSLPKGQYLGPLDAEGATEYLWREGRVPEWINISVHRTDAHFTFLLLACCGRFTGEDGFLYHQAEGKPPFHVLGPPIPQEWHLDEHGKLDHTMSWKRMFELHGKYPLPRPSENDL